MIIRGDFSWCLLFRVDCVRWGSSSHIVTRIFDVFWKGFRHPIFGIFWKCFCHPIFDIFGSSSMILSLFFRWIWCLDLLMIFYCRIPFFVLLFISTSGNIRFSGWLDIRFLYFFEVARIGIASIKPFLFKYLHVVARENEVCFCQFSCVWNSFVCLFVRFCISSRQTFTMCMMNICQVTFLMSEIYAQIKKNTMIRFNPDEQCQM